MRAIKFRLRSPSGKVIVGFEKWYAGEYDSEEHCFKAIPQWMYSKDGSYWNPKPIANRFKDEFTGLQDKNGKEIYEGDVVLYDRKAIGEADYSKPVAVEWTKDLVRFDFAGSFNGFIYRSYEVIGNVYENPELMKTT
jgi:hypothetical protein